MTGFKFSCPWRFGDLAQLDQFLDSILLNLLCNREEDHDKLMYKQFQVQYCRRSMRREYGLTKIKKCEEWLKIIHIWLAITPVKKIWDERMKRVSNKKVRMDNIVIRTLTHDEFLQIVQNWQFPLTPDRMQLMLLLINAEANGAHLSLTCRQSCDSCKIKAANESRCYQPDMEGTCGRWEMKDQFDEKNILCPHNGEVCHNAPICKKGEPQC